MTDHARTTKDHSGTDSDYRFGRLDQLDDFEIAEGEPDIRGWTACTPDGVELGTVENLIVDTAAMEVRYLEVPVKKDLLGTDEDEPVLIPLSAARLDDDNDKVIVHRLDAKRLRDVPRSGRGPISDEHDKLLVIFFGPVPTSSEEDRSRFFGKRRKGREREKYLRSTSTVS